MPTNAIIKQMRWSPILLAIVFLLSVATAIFSGQYIWLCVVPFVFLITLAFVYPKSFYFLLIASIPLSTEWQITPSLGTDFPDEPLMWGLTLIIVLLLLKNKKFPLNTVQQPITLLLGASLCWTVISTLFSTHPILSFKYLLAKIWYIIPFCIGTLMFLKSKIDYIKLAKCLIVPMAFAVIIILVRHSLSGFSFERVNKINGPFFRNHVNYSALLVCLIPVLYALMKIDSKMKLLWKALLGLFLIGLYFSYARGAWLALVVGLMIVFAIRKNILHWLLFGASFMVIVAGIWLMSNNNYMKFTPNYEKTIYHADLSEHLEATYTMKDLSAVERFYRWIAAWKMAKSHPITGFGPNTFYNNYRGYTVNSFKTYVSNNPEHSTVHNYFLMQLAEQGIPGLLLFVALFFTLLLTAQKGFHSQKNIFHKQLALAIGCILAMIGTLIFVSDLIETDKIGSIFYLCAGTLINLELGIRNQESRELYF
jgi:O-antigen ligase